MDDYYHDAIVKMLKRSDENLSSPPYVSFVQNGHYDEFDAWRRRRNVMPSEKKMYDYEITKRTGLMYRDMATDGQKWPKNIIKSKLIIHRKSIYVL
ncbi:hypothetical protein GOB83_12430 [Acetobacter fabarum]|uniref:hypothetical protein n=1 Tax=Acetobacter fabarum TaxID=483199 RepID=UPI001699F07A|nr:hypothetical protein [Acetobacter fabarum]NHO42972.1 hypothetical protein [Acetobacter fabarum]